MSCHKPIHHIYVDALKPQTPNTHNSSIHRTSKQTFNTCVPPLCVFLFFISVSHFLSLRMLPYMYMCLGVLEKEFYEADVEVIPITFPFATSHIWWPINQANKLNIKFDFRSNRTTAVLAYGDVTTSEGNGFWEVSIYIYRTFVMECVFYKNMLVYVCFVVCMLYLLTFMNVCSRLNIRLFLF